jgi:hypothetical protein
MTVKQCICKKGIWCSSESCMKKNDLGFGKLCEYYKVRSGHRKFRFSESVSSVRHV